MVVTPMRDKPEPGKPAPGRDSDRENALMKTDEVLATLEISKPTLYVLIDEGRIAPYPPKNPLLKRPRRLTFKREDVMALKAQIDEAQASQD